MAPAPTPANTLDDGPLLSVPSRSPEGRLLGAPAPGVDGGCQARWRTPSTKSSRLAEDEPGQVQPHAAGMAGPLSAGGEAVIGRGARQDPGRRRPRRPAVGHGRGARRDRRAGGRGGLRRGRAPTAPGGRVRGRPPRRQHAGDGRLRDGRPHPPARRSRQTPIIFLTADPDELRAAQGYSLGAVDYIVCPFVPDVLRAKVRVFVELSRAREQRVALSRAEAAREAAEEESHRLRVLADASGVLARSLDAATLVADLLPLLVPALGDAAATALCDGAGGAPKIELALRRGGRPAPADGAGPRRAR